MLLRTAFALGGLTLLAAVTAPVQAEPRCVIELFTSQGCSSCPPADQLLGELAHDPNVVSLSFPVDYWDYIGWRDTFAQPAFTARQKAYAIARGDGQVYTPQAVVDGLSHAVGSDRAELRAAMTSSLGRKGALSVPVTLNGAGKGVRVEIGAATGDAPKSAEVWLVRVAHSRKVSIGRGENSGRAVTYTNVVRAMTRLGDWSGEARGFDVAEALGGDADGYVVLLQTRDQGRPGVILGAAKSAGL